MKKPEHIVMVYMGSFIFAENGSQVRALSLLKWLQANFRQVTVYSLAGKMDGWWEDRQRAALEQQFPDVQLVVEKESPWLALAARFKKAVISISPRLCRRMLSLRVPGLTPEFHRLLRSRTKPVLCVNYVDNLARLNGFDPGKCIVETHDVQFIRRSKGAGRSPLGLKALARLRMEFGQIGAVAAAVGISRNEAYLIRNLALPNRTYYIPEYDKRPVVTSVVQDKTIDLLFVASSNIINERGLIALFERPDLDLSRYRIAICGSICNLNSIKELGAREPNLVLLGFVKDLSEVYAKSKVCLSPTSGTGLNLKIVEALRHGRPILASKNAMDGLMSGYGECVFPITAANLTRLVEDESEMKAASDAALRYYGAFMNTGDLHEYTAFVTRLGQAFAIETPEPSRRTA